MNILIVVAIPCYMAALGHGAPRPERSALLADPQAQEMVQRSRSLTEKILLSIPDAHGSCVRSEALQLDSSENAKLGIMALTIGIPSAPVLRVVSDNFPGETFLRRVSEGLQLHRALLAAVSPHLETTKKVSELQADIRDLLVQINKMLKMVQGEAAVQPTQAPVTLKLPGDYEVQVAAHLTLVQLRDFSQDLVRCLRILDQSHDNDTDS